MRVKCLGNSFHTAVIFWLTVDSQSYILMPKIEKKDGLLMSQLINKMYQMFNL